MKLEFRRDPQTDAVSLFAELSGDEMRELPPDLGEPGFEPNIFYWFHRVIAWRRKQKRRRA